MPTWAALLTGGAIVGGFVAGGLLVRWVNKQLDREMRGH